MKLKNHTILAAVIGLSAGAPPEGLAALALGSVLPDKLDFNIAMGSEYLFRKVHRGITHWPWIYVAFFCAGLALPPSLPYVQSFVLWLSLGAIIHLVGDMMTPGGIPWAWPLRKKVSLRLFKTGTIGEYLFTWAVVALGGAGLYGAYRLWGYSPLSEYLTWKGSLFPL